ncbi:hypothetical protein NG819_18485 [Pseudarthrobacter sp. Fe7]|nr:hypothetical protein NG819_18485 [Pseudarthrobacter sp. Fe7]
MSEDQGTPPPTERGRGRQREPRGGYLGIGTASGALVLYILYLWATIRDGPPPWPNSIFAGPAAFVPVAVYLGVAVVLAIEPRTSRTGAGMLIGLGIFTLLGGGLCVGALVQAGR